MNVLNISNWWEYFLEFDMKIWRICWKRLTSKWNVGHVASDRKSWTQPKKLRNVFRHDVIHFHSHQINSNLNYNLWHYNLWRIIKYSVILIIMYESIGKWIARLLTPLPPPSGGLISSSDVTATINRWQSNLHANPLIQIIVCLLT